MTAIDKLNRLDQFSPNDLLPIWSDVNRDTRSAPVGALVEFLGEPLVEEAQQAADAAAASQAGAAAERIGAEAAKNAAIAAQAAATLAKDGAETAKAGAESARDAALIQAGVYVDEPTGRAAVADGQAFKAQGSGDVAAFEYRRINSGSSTLIATYPSAAAVLRPDWSGRMNGWVDTYFRHAPTDFSDFLGRRRWRGHTGGNNYTGCSIVTTTSSPYDGRVFRKTGPSNQAGALIWLDDIGVSPLDTLTIVSLVAGTVGRDGYMLGDFYTAANAATGSAIAGGSWVAIRDDGGTGAILSASPQRLRASPTVPAGAAAVHVRFYSSTAGASDVLDVYSLWALKGATAPSWSTLGDESWSSTLLKLQQSTIEAQQATITAQASKISSLETSVPIGLRDFKRDLTNNMVQFLGAVFAGDSITWGMSATGIASITPRTGALTDARNNGSSATWFNLLHKYLGRAYFDDTVATETAWPGTPSGVAIFEYNKTVNLFPGYAPFERTNTNTVSPGAWTQGPYTVAAKLGFYIQALVNSGSDNLRLKFPPFTGYEFDLVFATQTNGARYDLIVDGVTLGTYSTQTGDTGLPAAFGNVRTHSLGGFKRGAVIELKAVPGDVARTSLRIEAVTVNRRLRVTNQGIIGTTAARYFVDGNATACLQEGDRYVFPQLGTNDRAMAASYGLPEGPSTLATYMGRLCDAWEGVGVKPIILCANAVLDNSLPTYKYSMSVVRDTLRQFALDRKYSFVDQYAPTSAKLAAGDSSFLADGLHPNDAGHAMEFDTLKNAIDSACKCSPMQVSLLSGIYRDSVSDLRTALPRNMVPVPKDSGVSKGYLAPADGLTEFATGLGTGRGGINWNGVCHRVMGTKLVRVAADGTVTELGDVGSGGDVTLDYSFDRLAVASGGRLYYWDGTTLTEVTDPDLGTVVDMIWIAGYFMTTDGQFLIVTELNDPTSVDPLKYGSSESDPDPVVALMKVRNEVLALNRYTVETFQNAGGDGFPFQRIDGAQVQRGCVGTHACAKFMDSVAFVGGGRGEAPAVWIASGGSSEKLSTREVDILLRGYTEVQLAASVLESRLTDAHQLLYLHLPDRTLVFDGAGSTVLGTPIWFELGSTLNGPGQYRARHFTWVYDRWLCDDPQASRVGALTRSSSAHYGATIGWEFSTVMLYNNGSAGLIHQMELVALTGAPTGEAPTIWTSYTLDGVTWSEQRSIPAGATGQTLKRLCWRRQGKMRSWRIQKFGGTSDAHLPVVRLELQVEPLGI